MKKKSYKTLEKELKGVLENLNKMGEANMNLKDVKYSLEREVKNLSSVISENRSQFIRDLGNIKDEHSRVLLEIIRWQVNPETAKTPFKGDEYRSTIGSDLRI